MDKVELLTVEDSFDLGERGVVLIPDFSVPDGWRNQSEEITLRIPDGREFTTNANFQIVHFNLSKQYSPDEAWRVIVHVLGWSAERIPTGTKIFASANLRDTLLRGTA